MSPSFSKVIVGGVLLASAAGIAAGCSSEDPARRGQLMLVIKTDMDVPKDVSAVRIEVLAGGVPRHDLTYELGPDDTYLKLPGTLAIVAGDDPSVPVKIRVLAYRGQESKILREAITTVPPDRIASLPMSISWLCWEQAKALPAGVPGDRPNAETTCQPGETCSAGSCVAGEISSEDLPAFSPNQVFGGAAAPGALGTCFDTLACFAEGALVPVDLADCSIEAPSGGSTDVNVALMLQPGGQGICNGSTCLVPLDAAENEGWAEASGRLKLPPAVCTEILSGDVIGVATTTSCAQKTPAIPTCGPWSSVTSLPGTFDGGAAFDAPDPCFKTVGDDGDHCGSAIGGEPSTLYTCEAGQTTSSAPCSAGCAVSDGGNDSCVGDGGADGPDATLANIGAACAGPGACGGGLTCLTPDSTLFAGEGPGGGLCALDCTSDASVCPVGFPCVEVGDQDYCLPSCTIGTPGSADCLGRPDMACKGVSLTTGGSASTCVPICAKDADCGGALRCNLATGHCGTTAPGTGSPLGGYCEVGVDQCADGVCQEWSDGTGLTASQCTGLCTLGTTEACKWNGVPPDAGAPDHQACLIPAEPNGADGDLGYCTNLCNNGCNDCHSMFSCKLFENPADQTKYGAMGYCLPYWIFDGGLGC